MEDSQIMYDEYRTFLKTYFLDKKLMINSFGIKISFYFHSRIQKVSHKQANKTKEASNGDDQKGEQASCVERIFIRFI